MENALEFLRELKENNNRVWFEKNRPIYEKNKADLLHLVSQILNELQNNDVAFAPILPKDCLFRINRDVRFATDKSPYKTNFACYFDKKGKKSPGPGFYLHIEPNNCFLGGGIWMPETQLLKRIRTEIDYDSQGFESIITQKDFVSYYPKLEGESLKKVPKEYQNHPNSDWFRYKNFIFMHKFDEQKITDKEFYLYVSQAFNLLNPFHNFLNKVLEN